MGAEIVCGFLPTFAASHPFLKVGNTTCENGEGFLTSDSACGILGQVLGRRYRVLMAADVHSANCLSSIVLHILQAFPGNNLLDPAGKAKAIPENNPRSCG
jgi:hypothetical protein